MADHGQTLVHDGVSLAEIYADVEGVLPLGSNRAAHVYLQPGLPPRSGVPSPRASTRAGRRGDTVPRGRERVARREGEELVFAPTAGGGFTLSGDASILDQPDALARTWAALANPNAGAVLVSPRRVRVRRPRRRRPRRWRLSRFARRRGHRGAAAHRRRRGHGGQHRRRRARDPRPLRRRAHPHTRSSAPRTGQPLPSPDVIEPPATTSGEGRPAACASRRASQQLGAARPVLRRRRQRLRRQPRRLRVPPGRAGVHYLPAAVGSFLVAVASNYTWNRVWTFRDQRGHVAYQGIRFLVVSPVSARREPRRALRACRGGARGARRPRRSRSYS